MTDAELIAEARERWDDDPRIGPLLLALAARLEAITTPAEGLPLTHEREAHLRGFCAVWSPGASGPWGEACRDLLAALDHERAHRVRAEGVIQDMCAESARHEAGVREGVARALAALRGVADAYPIRSEALAEGVRAVEACGPALLPQHAVTHARMVRLEAALEKIAARAGGAESDAWVGPAAREALGGES